MNNVKSHAEVCEKLNQVYREKNKKYGDSFTISVKKYGLIAALTRISDKFNRFEQLILTKSNGTADESLIDTCLDAANYFIMTAMFLETEANEKAEAESREEALRDLLRADEDCLIKPEWIYKVGNPSDTNDSAL